MSYFEDWRDAFAASPFFECDFFDIARRRERDRLRASVADADLIVALHSSCADSVRQLRACAPLLDGRRGPLVVFAGNEVNLPASPMGEKIRTFAELGTDVIVTQLLPTAGEWLYASSGAAILSLPHALNPEAFQPRSEPSTRPIDLGVRSWRYYAFLGDDDRRRLMDRVRENRFVPPLELDIGETERLSRREWAAFLNTCKGTVSTEAGSFFLEPDDALLSAMIADLDAAAPGLVLRSSARLAVLKNAIPRALRQRVRSRLGKGFLQLDSVRNERVELDSLYERYFKDRRPAPEYTKAVSSRHFEAAGTKTCQILVRGRFNDILEADVHYLAVERDLSDLDDAVDRFRDEGLRRRIVEQAYDLVSSAHTYRHRLRVLYDFLS